MPGLASMLWACGERGQPAHKRTAAPLNPVGSIAASRAEILARPFFCSTEHREENWDYLVFVSWLAGAGTEALLPACPPSSLRIRSISCRNTSMDLLPGMTTPTTFP